MPESRLVLPDRPAALAAAPVAVWREDLVIDTYLPAPADPYPAFLGSRVYQGSSGQVYPLPFHERISQHKTPHAWDAVHLENPWVRLVVLPELGGRIHVGLDRTTDYDFFYRNDVVKPALVGLAGPWVSGGVELNWPQHHRPATFLPTQCQVEHEADGSVTVWCSDHDPFARMKGMHGVRLRPDSSLVELRVRLHNRTEDTQTFLWWANVAAPANDDYQSFFPTDVRAVADHAERAVTAFPAADRPYYGVDYPARVTPDRPDADRIDWYRNIPVPTSYMCVGTEDDFFGGYDHGRGAGFVHWADHRIAPGKKQWTWGNAPFGWAWDANLTDTNGPYVELMAGVYTDNQPDFSFLAPGETKTFSQYWYPIQGTGPVHQATREVAVRLDVEPGEGSTALRVAVATTRVREGLEIALLRPDGQELRRWREGVAPGRPFVVESVLDGGRAGPDVVLEVRHAGEELLRWRHRPEPTTTPVPEPATEPDPPEQVRTVEELYLVGRHLEQYRHATRSPEPYWREGLRRDPDDVRTNVAMAARHHRAGRYADAEQHAHRAVRRLTRLNGNPEDGEAHYRWGLALARLGRTAEAYDAHARASWDYAWRAPARLAMARLDAAAGRDDDAVANAREVLRTDADSLQARAVLAVALRRLGRPEEATAVLVEARALDPLDAWTRDLAGGPPAPDPTVGLDVALEHASVGETAAALRLLDDVARRGTVPGQVEVRPLAWYHRADLLARSGDADGARAALERARTAPRRHCLASRPDDVEALRRLTADHPDEAGAWTLLGHWWYAHGRHEDAVHAWRTALATDPDDVVVRRNLAVASYDIEHDAVAARRHYEQALELAPGDARLLYELDQLLARTGESTAARLARLEARADVVARRDDLTVELAGLLTAEGRTEDAVGLLRGRRFQPWEGGEGRVLGAWDEAQLALARAALTAGDGDRAVAAVGEALDPPAGLGEARHPLANTAHLLLVLGDGHRAAGRADDARAAWRRAATSLGDVGDLGAVPHSELTYAAVLAARRLGDTARADATLAGLEAFVEELAAAPVAVDYFATSLPSMLLFREDLAAVRATRVLLLTAQVHALHGRREEALAAVEEVFAREPGAARALDLRRDLTAEEAER